MKLNSLKEKYFYDMQNMFVSKNILPQDFRNISSSDWKSINLIEPAIAAQCKKHKKNMEAKAQMEREIQAAMSKRRKG